MKRHRGGYHYALFLQRLKLSAQYAPNDPDKKYPVLTEENVEKALWELLDIDSAIDNAPDQEEEIRRFLHEDVLPVICDRLEDETEFTIPTFQ